MTWLMALALGLVQGLTEFLPISSSGHLVLLPALLDWRAAPLVFDVTVHLGTLVAVIAVLWPDLLALLRAWWHGLWNRQPLETPEARLAWWIVLGTIPGALVGYLFEDLFESLFGAPRAAGGFLLLTALLLVLAEWLGRRQRDLSDATWADGMLIGIGQAAAIAPGLSRSGSTMAVGMFRGLKREAAARFSFLLSVPIIAGTGIFQLGKMINEGPGESQLLLLLVGFAAAALSGYGAIRFLLAYLRRRPLYPFALYCALLGLLALLLL